MSAGNGLAGRVQPTVPSWLLPSYPYRPDIMVLAGWAQERYDAGEFPTEADFGSITVIPVELCFANDFFLDDAVLRKRRAYSTDPPPAADDPSFVTPPGSPRSSSNAARSPPPAPRKPPRSPPPPL